jgi:hypothetical protein
MRSGQGRAYQYQYVSLPVRREKRPAVGADEKVLGGIGMDILYVLSVSVLCYLSPPCLVSK